MINAEAIGVVVTDLTGYSSSLLTASEPRSQPAWAPIRPTIEECSSGRVGAPVHDEAVYRYRHRVEVMMAAEA